MNVATEDNQFFQGFSEKAKARLLAAVKSKTFPAGTELFAEGDPPDWVYLLDAGQVEVVKESAPGRWVVLSTVEPGDCFGEIGVLFHSGRTTGARAKDDIAVGLLPSAEVRAVLAAEPTQVTLRLAMRLLTYLRAIDEKFVFEILHKEKIQLIGELAGSIIHDFRNPLTSIKLAAQIITGEHKDPRTSACSTIIETQANRMAGMAQELLEFARGKPSLKKEKISVAELFGNFRWLNQSLLESARARLVLAPCEATILADRDRLMRVLQNLVGNAVDMMPEAGGEVRLEAEARPDSVEIRVSDDGPGIPEAIRGRLFQPFVTHGKQKGTGLGLVIAKTLVEAHGGSISFKTETGKGTCFCIVLPRS